MQDVDDAGAERDHQEVESRGGKDEPCRWRLRSQKCMYTAVLLSVFCRCTCALNHHQQVSKLSPRGADRWCKRRSWRGSKNSRCYTVSTWPRCTIQFTLDSNQQCCICFCYGLVNSFLWSIRTLDKTISNLEMELASAKASQESMLNGAPMSESTGKWKYFMVIGINTAFSSRKRRDSVRATWMPQG